MRLRVWRPRRAGQVVGKTHLLLGESVTWCGEHVPIGAVTNQYTTDSPLPFDCRLCERAWLSRPRKGKR